MDSKKWLLFSGIAVLLLALISYTATLPKATAQILGDGCCANPSAIEYLTGIYCSAVPGQMLTELDILGGLCIIGEMSWTFHKHCFQFAWAVVVLQALKSLAILGQKPLAILLLRVAVLVLLAYLWALQLPFFDPLPP